MIKRDDILWKVILEDIFDDFLRFFFPDADSIFDMERPFEFLDKELEQLYPAQDESNLRYVDKLVKVFTKENTERWILVHIEVQGYKDKDFGERMFTYYYRILDKYSKPITAFAIFTDPHKNFHPKFYENTFLGTRLLYEYNTYKVLEQNEEELLKSENPFAIAILTAKIALRKGKIKDENLLTLKIDLLKRLLIKKISKDKIRFLLRFLSLYIRFDLEENNLKFEKEKRIITKNDKSIMGIEQFILDRAKKQGVAEASMEIVKNLLRDTDFSNEKIASLACVSVEFVEKQRKKLK